MYIYIYIYTHTYVIACTYIRRGVKGVSTNGVTANFQFFAEGLVGRCLLLSPQKCQGVPFSPIGRNSVLQQRPH